MSTPEDKVTTPGSGKPSSGSSSDSGSNQVSSAPISPLATAGNFIKKAAKGAKDNISNQWNKNFLGPEPPKPKEDKDKKKDPMLELLDSLVKTVGDINHGVTNLAKGAAGAGFDLAKKGVLSAFDAIKNKVSGSNNPDSSPSDSSDPGPTTTPNTPSTTQVDSSDPGPTTTPTTPSSTSQVDSSDTVSTVSTTPTTPSTDQVDSGNTDPNVSTTPTTSTVDQSSSTTDQSSTPQEPTVSMSPLPDVDSDPIQALQSSEFPTGTDLSTTPSESPSVEQVETIAPMNP